MTTVLKDPINAGSVLIIVGVVFTFFSLDRLGSSHPLIWSCLALELGGLAIIIRERIRRKAYAKLILVAVSLSICVIILVIYLLYFQPPMLPPPA
jgi:ABC-type Fe3+-siderophore transport system permease subunit